MNINDWLFENNDTIDFYTKEEEYSMIKKIQEGDLKVRDEFLKHYYLLVLSIARKIITYYSSLELEDLIQEGSIGLMVAIQKFDFSYDTRFTTYATPWIYKHINNFINCNTFLSLNDILYEDIERLQLIDDEKARKDLDDAELNILNSQLINIMEEVLTKREKEILILRNGLDGEGVRTFREIESMYNLTFQAIEATEKKAIYKLRTSSFSQKNINLSINPDLFMQKWKIFTSLKVKNFTKKYPSFYSLFPSYTTDEISSIIKLLNEKAINLISKVYNASNDFCDPTNRIISSTDIVSLSEVINIVYNDLYLKYGFKAQETEPIIEQKSISVYDYFNEYEKDKIEDAISKLNEPYKELLYEKFGPDLLGQPIDYNFDSAFNYKFRFVKAKLRTLLK